MTTQDNSLPQPVVDEKNKSSNSGPETTVNNLLKQRLNTFLISYFGYLAFALAVIIFAVGLFWFVYPQYRKIAESGQVADKNLQAEYETKLSYLSMIRDLKSSYQQISETDRKKIEAMIPIGDQSVSLIPEIESIVLRNGAVLNSIKLEENAKGQSPLTVRAEPGENQAAVAGIFEQLPAGIGLTKVEINLSSVNYLVLKNLLKTFENNLWLTDIAKVDYGAKDNKAIFIIYSYYLLR